jgi:hypothetical protein
MTEPFDFTLFQRATVLVGKRNSGKSRLLRYMIKQERECFDEIFIVSSNEGMTGFFEGLVPSNKIFEEYKDEWLGRLFDRLKTVNAGTEGDHDRMKHVLVVLDDVCGSNNFQHRSKWPHLTAAFTKGRHYGMSIVLTAQALTLVSLTWRSNADAVLVSQLNARGLQMLGDEFLFGDLTKREFMTLVRKATTQYTFLAINCSTVRSTSELGLIYGTLRCPADEIA